MGVKWMNAAAAATSYPTDGKGGVTATAGSSAFLVAPGAGPNAWDNKECILMELILIPAVAATLTCTVTSHDGTSDVLPPFNMAAAASPVAIDLHGLAFRGIKIVMAGAGSVAVLKFEVGGDATY